MVVAATGGSGLGVAAVATATTRAFAPSRRLSKRAPSTGASAVRPSSTSARFLTGSRRPVVTVRRSSLPFSTVHTYSWPDAELMALMGTVSRGVASPIWTCATAYWPARIVSFGFCSCTATPMARVPASAAGAMRASLPSSGLSMPSIRSVTGMPVTLKIEGVDKPIDGKLARIAPAAEAGTRSIGVTVQLQNPHETLRGGQYAVAQVQIGDAQPHLTVPIGAISSASGQEYVWTVEGGKLLRRTVTTGRRDLVRGRAEVLDGLSPDTLVLGARFDNLREGARARVVAVATAATPKPLPPVSATR